MSRIDNKEAILTEYYSCSTDAHAPRFFSSNVNADDSGAHSVNSFAENFLK